MNNVSVSVTLEVQVSAKTGNTFVCAVVDLGYTKKRLAFGRDALELFGFSPRDLDCNTPGVLARGTFVLA